MATAAIPVRSRGLAQILAWRRVRFVLIVSAMFGLILSLGSQTPTYIWLIRTAIVGLSILFMFGLFEQRPRKLWRPFSRWGWQLLGVVIVIPFAALLAYWVTTGGDPQLDTDKLRQMGYAQLCMSALLFAPWIAVGIASADELVLTAGALYVDSQAQRPQALTIRTDAGSVRHIGTQYQVRTHADDMEVIVREGRVMIANASGTSSGVAGERIRVTPRGQIVRSTVPAHDPAWQWAAHTAPLFDINDQTLAMFAAWVARETGRKVVYESGAAQSAANELRLRGSIAGLDPDTALNAVLSTTQLRRYQTEDELIGIALAGD